MRDNGSLHPQSRRANSSWERVEDCSSAYLIRCTKKRKVSMIYFSLLTIDLALNLVCLSPWIRKTQAGLPEFRIAIPIAHSTRPGNN
jgi:hypothetical protein